MSGRSTTQDTTSRQTQEGVREKRAGLLALAGSAELVAHDADAMRRLADRVVELGAGRVHRHGAATELLGSAA
ncbi:hypothetical protein GCM10009610_31090 [Pseudonocardia xinjiangensis]